MRHLRFLLASLLLLPLVALAATSPFEGRWKLDRERSTALDGWHEWTLEVRVNGSQVALQHDMKWGKTELSATNTVDTAKAVALPDFFRVEQRHMAIYPAKGKSTPVRASWLDAGRTLRVEADVPLEISQAETVMRLYSEYRLVEGDRELLLIELHSSRPRPLVYRFTKITAEK
ncbi:MAG: hypothetical protein RL091_825 [Verrucomicrobiota bacterium]|jgi:hypothetical protein